MEYIHINTEWWTLPNLKASFGVHNRIEKFVAGSHIREVAVR
jgi:hypothetical protein